MTCNERHTAQASASHPATHLESNNLINQYTVMIQKKVRGREIATENYHGQKVLPMDLKNLSVLLAFHQQHQRSSNAYKQ